jgi:hypothetical protein
MRAFMFVALFASVALARGARAQADTSRGRDSLRLEQAREEFSNRVNTLLLNAYRATALRRPARPDSQMVVVPPSSCPMYVAAPTNPTVPIPVAHTDSLTVESMPVARPGCANPLFRPQR